MTIQYPNITAGTPQEQIAQLRTFLFQLVEQLNVQQSGIGAVQTGLAVTVNRSKADGVNASVAAPAGTFNQIKSLIIKSADIVDAYYEEINKRLEGKYVAESAFGTYSQETDLQISANSERINQVFTNLQSLSGDFEQMISTRANIRQGLLFEVGDTTLEEELGQVIPEGTPIYGVEVGQTVQEDDVEVFKKFARFTAYGMTLYDNNGKLSAYITDNRLHIPNAVIKVSLVRGGFRETYLPDGGSVERWVGV